MSWFGGNPWATLAIGGPIPALYQVQQKARQDQANAVRNAQDADQRLQAEAATSAAVAANAQIADAKRRRRASALGLGEDSTTDGLGAPSGALSGGAAAQRSLAAFYGAPGGMSGGALGGGAAVSAGPAVGGFGGGGSGGGGIRYGQTMQR